MSSTSAAASQYRPITDEAETRGHREQFEDGDQLLIPRKAVAKSRPSVVNATATDDQGGREIQVPSKRPTQTRRYSVVRTWWLEILCCILFLAAFFAIVATVYPYSGKKPPNWKYGLTLNTFIAIETVILKAAMVFVVAEGLGQLKWSWFDRERTLHDLTTYDNASRGPWGALLLLFKLRGRQLVSCVGAFVILAALIIDPFAQQLVSAQDCDVIVLNTNATISRSNYFNESSQTGADGSTASVPLQNAINAGIYAPGGAVAFGCVTGNCTFGQPYSTVGYCGSCLDLTTNLTVENITYPYYSYPNGTSLYETAVNISLHSDPAAGYDIASTSILAGGPNQTVFALNSYLETDVGSETDIVASFLDSDFTRCGGNFGTIEDARRNLTWGCGNLGLSLPTDGKNPNAAVGAARCSLSPCIRTYTASVVNGTLNEQLINVSGDDNFGTSATTFDVKCLSREESNALTNIGYDLRGKSWVPNNTTTPYTNGFNFNNTNISISYDCIYGFAPVAIQNLDLFLNSWLSGQLVYTGAVSRTGPAVLQAIYNSENLTFESLNETWRNMSDSITKYMREHGAGDSGAGFSYSTPALGELHTEQSCIKVQWLFIIYPAVLVVLALIFFIAMVFETSHGRMDLDWKSSPLALIFHGLDHDTVKQTDERFSLLGTRDMENVAKEMAVRLSQNDSGWKLVRVNKDVEMNEARHGNRL
jgi:hypothetical protein